MPRTLPRRRSVILGVFFLLAMLILIQPSGLSAPPKKVAMSSRPSTSSPANTQVANFVGKAIATNMPSSGSGLVRPQGVVDVEKLPPGPSQDPSFVSFKMPDVGADYQSSTPAPAPVASPTTAPSPKGVSLVSSFDALHYGFNGFLGNYGTPPDVQVAAGTTYVVEMVNIIGGVYTKTGSNVNIFSLSSFFLTGFDYITDPKVLYDSTSGRWFASLEDGTAGNVMVAVSQTSDPTGSWWVYALTFGNCPDQPILGVNDDKIVVSTNEFTVCSSSGFFIGAEYFVLNKSEMLSGLSVDYTPFGPYSSLFSVHPVQSLSTTTTEYMVCITCSTPTSYSITGVPPGPVTSSSNIFSISSFSSPPSAVQPGTSDLIDSGGNRVQDAIWYQGALWFAFDDGCTPSGDSQTRSCFRLVQLQTASTAVTQDFDVSGAVGEYLFYPALSTDSNGNLDVVYGYSSAASYPGIIVAGRSATDSPNSLESTVILMRAGSGYETTYCNSGVCRYGDYFGAALDPADPTLVWVAGEWGTGSGWSTTIGSMRVLTGTTLTVSYSVVRGGSSYSPPLLVYYWEGKAYSVVLTTTPAAYAVDTGSSWSATLQLSGSTGTERWQTDQLVSGTATSSQTLAFAYYHQYVQTLSYSVSDSSIPPSLSFAADQFGSIVSQPMSTVATSYWFDNGDTWSVTDPITGGSGERWQINTASQVDHGTISSAQTYAFKYYHQYQVSFVASPAGAGTTTPSGSGLWENTGQLPISASSNPGYAFKVWNSSSSGITFSTPSSFNTLAAISGTGTIFANFLHGVTESVTITPSPSNSPSATISISGCHATASSIPADGSPHSFAADASCSLNFTVPSDTSNNRYRFSPLATVWVYTTISSGADTKSNVLYYQDIMACSYSVIGGGTPGAPALTYAYLGNPASTLTLRPNPVSCYLDHETTWSVTNPSSDSTATERWFTLRSSGTSTPGGEIAPAYHHQFLETLQFAVLGGGSPSAPSVKLTQFGTTTSVTAATDGSVQQWIDAQTIVTYPVDLSPSSSTERWQAPSQPTFTVNSSATLNPAYYHQFLTTLSYSIIGGGSPTGPSLDADQFGSTLLQLLTNSPAGYWFDSGAAWVVSNPLSSSTASERWEIAVATNGTLSTSTTQTMQFSYYHQYALTISYATVGNGTPSAPMMNSTQLGHFGSTSLATTATTYWLDSGSAWSVPPLLSPSSSSERWVWNGTRGSMITSALTERVTYQHQYYVHVTVAATGGGTVSPPSKWYDDGSSINLIASPNSGWTVGVWNGNGLSSYSGNATLQLVTIGGSFNETAVFYPGLNLVVDSGGTVSYSYGAIFSQVSSQRVIYVPPGTNVSLTANPSFFYSFGSWAQSSASTKSHMGVIVNAPLTIEAKFGYNFVSIGIFPVIGISAVGVVYYLKWIRRAR